MDIHISDSWVKVLLLILIWEIIWKGLALWRAGRNNQPGWFVSLLVINSVGLLPIIYLLTHKKEASHDQA